MPTTTELATRVLKRIGVLDPSENQTAQESADVIAVMNSVYRSLKERGHIEWVLTSIPTMYQEPFITYVGYYVAPHFGVQGVIDVMTRNEALREMNSLAQVKTDPRAKPVVDF